MSSPVEFARTSKVTVRLLQEQELSEADRIFRLAFGTFIGLPDPGSFNEGADFLSHRWRVDPAAAFAAEFDGSLAGTNLGTNWGSVGFFGPLTICPNLWDRGIGKRLMEPIMDLFTRWETKHAGLFTFAQSQKHVGLYQKFGFWPRFLTAIMSMPVRPVEFPPMARRYSQFSESERIESLQACRTLTNSIYEGLDVTREITAIQDQKLGDTIVLWDDSRVVGVAVCHIGEGTEAGPGNCYVKFGCAEGDKPAENFDWLLSAIDALAGASGMSRIVAGVNLGRSEAFQKMHAHGFRTDFQGVAMHQPNEDGYSHSLAFVIDDWR